MKKKHYSSFLKGFQMKQITQIFLGGESPTLKLFMYMVSV